MNRIFNEEIKERYLKENYPEQTQKVIRHIFTLSESTEKILNKDLCDFSDDQIANIIKNTNPLSVTSAKSTARYISRYISWSIENGFRTSNLNPIKGIDDTWYDSLVTHTLKIHYSEEELLKDIIEDPKMLNSVDQAMICLIYEGIIGKGFSELRNLHKDHIGWGVNIITVYEEDGKDKKEREVTVSDITLKYLQKAIDQPIYYNYTIESDGDVKWWNGDYKEREFVASNYIFKNIKSARAVEGEPVNPSVFYSRMNNIKTAFDLEYLTPNAIKQSGMIKMAADLYLRDGELSTEQFRIIGEKYNAPKASSGKWEYYNVSLMKEFITSEKLKELYDISVKI